MDELNRRALRLLCEHLRPLVDAELARGNSVINIAEYAWTECDLDVSLKNAVDRTALEQVRESSEGPEYWENDDPHYQIEAGFVCKACRHSFAGPKPA